MDKFEDIIKQKVEQFEPKFNEVHWNALDQKLTSIKKAKIIKNTVLSLAASLVAVLGVYFIFQNSTSVQPIKTSQTQENKVVNNGTTQNTINTNTTITKEKKQTDKNVPVLPLDQTKFDKLELIKIESTDNKNDKNAEVVEIVPAEKFTKDYQNNQEILSAEFIVSNKKVCLGDEISFEVNDNKELLAYSWDFGDGNSSNKPNSKHRYKQHGNYVVTLLVTNKKTAQESKSTQNITILSLPNVEFTYMEQSTQFDDNKLKYPKTIFSCKGEVSDAYEWNFGNSKTLKEKQPTFIFDKKGEYNVSLSAKNNLGCTNTLTKKIIIENSFELFAPTAFTPNFDGNNDDFMPEALTTWDIKFEMMIKNTSGNVVYKTSDKNAPWNGSLNNQGNTLEEGMYFWQIITFDAEGKPYQHAGKINLMK